MVKKRIQCSHNKRRDQCIECNGCSHKVVKHRCGPCKGCDHGVKYYEKCKICNNCGHNNIKSRCSECNGSQLCRHKISKYYCKECKGGGICQHGREKRRCGDCHGYQICGTPMCTTLGSKRFNWLCTYCYSNLYPEAEIIKNFRTKEKTVVNYIKGVFGLNQFSWVENKAVIDGCSKKRPDLLLDLGHSIIIIEVDEYQHLKNNYQCEDVRLLQISQDLGHRPLVVIRFNPDDYVSNGKKITSCWSTSQKLGVLSIKKCKIEEWSERLNTLKERVQFWLNNQSSKTLHIERLFYDE